MTIKVGDTYCSCTARPDDVAVYAKKSRLCAKLYFLIYPHGGSLT